MNKLYYGDNRDILQKHIDSESVDLIYLDPPFNSKASYNILFRSASGASSKAQVTAFEDYWHWTEQTESTYREIIETGKPEVVQMIKSFRGFVGENDMMAYLVEMCVRLTELQRVLKKAGTIYLHCDPTASHYLKIIMDTIFGKRNMRNEIIWAYRGGGVPKSDFAHRHDVILRYSKSDKYLFNVDEIRIPYSKETEERLKYKARSFRDSKVYDAYEKNPHGKHPEDWWAIQPIMPSDPERLGYPTQKPERLLNIIIKASSNSGDVVLDPFCGCGTTISVAQRLNRNWIGIDVTHLAINVIKLRLRDQFGAGIESQYEVIGEPRDVEGAINLARHDRYQFQWWALSLINARPYRDKKKGSDTGIDGYIYFMDEKDKEKSAIVSVKSGKVGVQQVRDLCHVIEREKAEFGLFISIESPTDPMIKEGLRQDIYKDPAGNAYPRLQIRTIAELLDGKGFQLPSVVPVYRRARSFKETNENLEIL